MPNLKFAVLFSATDRLSASAEQAAIEARAPAGSPMTFHPGQVLFPPLAAPLLDAGGTLTALLPTLLEAGSFAPAGDELRNCEGGKPPHQAYDEDSKREDKTRGQNYQPKRQTDRHTVDEGCHNQNIETVATPRQTDG